MGINIGRGKVGTQEDKDEALEAKQTVKAGESTFLYSVSLCKIIKMYQLPPPLKFLYMYKMSGLSTHPSQVESSHGHLTPNVTYIFLWMHE